MKSSRTTGLKLLLGIVAMIMAVNIHATDITRKETLLTHSLSSVPGLIADSIDLGDFYTEASVELYFTADSNGINNENICTIEIEFEDIYTE